MTFENSLKNILTLVTQIKILYTQFVTVRVELRSMLNWINISDFDKEIQLGDSLAQASLELMFIKSESVIEEYDQILNPQIFPEHREEILQFKNEIKPALKIIRRWTDRRTHRNTLVAHNLRIKGKESIFDLDTTLEINTLTFDNDFTVLYYTLIYMTFCIGKHFRNEVRNMDRSKIEDKVNFSGEYKSLKESLPEIKKLFDQSGFTFEELDRHIELVRGS